VDAWIVAMSQGEVKQQASILMEVLM